MKKKEKEKIEERAKKMDRHYVRSSFVDKDLSILLTHNNNKKKDREKHIPINLTINILQ
jgi:hypothetical protein